MGVIQWSQQMAWAVVFNKFVMGEGDSQFFVWQTDDGYPYLSGSFDPERLYHSIEAANNALINYKASKFFSPDVEFKVCRIYAAFTAVPEPEKAGG